MYLHIEISQSDINDFYTRNNVVHMSFSGSVLPPGEFGDVMFHNGTDWVAVEKSSLGFVPDSWLEGKDFAMKSEIPSLSGYAKESWVTSRGYATEGWVTGQGYATPAQLAQKLDTSIWDREFEPTSDVLRVKRSVLFTNQVIFDSY